MSTQPQPLPDTFPPLLERQLQVLGRLAEAGLAIAIALERQAKGEGVAVVQGDIALAYDRVARAVRFTIALQDRLIRKHRAREKAEALPPLSYGDLVVKEITSPKATRYYDVREALEQVIRSECEYDYKIEELLREAGRRLDHEDGYDAALDRPASEWVALICKDLGLTPDWAALAQEDWAQQEICSGEVGAPLEAWLEGKLDDPPTPAMGVFPLQPQAAPP